MSPVGAVFAAAVELVLKELAVKSLAVALEGSLSLALGLDERTDVCAGLGACVGALAMDDALLVLSFVGGG